MMGFARKLPPAGPWEAVGEYMSEANHTPAAPSDNKPERSIADENNIPTPTGEEER